MTEKELVRQLKELREIEPSQNWVILTKQRMFAGEPETGFKAGFFTYFPMFRYKLALAPIVSVFIIVGLFGFAQSTFPGDFLFSMKKMTETAHVAFSPQIEKPKNNLQLANKRLEELGRIAESNQVRNLDPAIKEFQLSINLAVQNLSEINISATSSNSVLIKEIVAETQRMAENKEKVESVLGAIVGSTEELDTAILQLEKQTAIYLIADLSQRTLSEEDAVILEEAKENFEQGNYSQALEQIWLLSNK